MRVPDRQTRITRRVILRGSALALPGAAAALSITPKAAWAEEAKNLAPDTLVTLARAARDTYPHDRFPDAYYITAVTVFDSAAPEVRDLLTTGATGLDDAAKRSRYTSYIAIYSEEERVAILKSVEDTPFFKKFRSELVVNIYNQKSVWAKLGYEGSSADQGGYINRGFNDIDWLS